MNRSMPGLPVNHQLPEFTQTYVHRVSDAIQSSHLLSSPSPPAPNPSLEGGEVKIFSRNQEDNTGRYPDIISRIPKIKLPSVTSFILDTEAVAWDREKKQIQPFQVLTTRKRKEVDAAEIQVQVCLYAFDLIYLNGESLVREPLSRRRQLLRENFVETEGEFVFATSLDTKDSEQIAEFLEQSVKDSCEGLMVKTLDVDAT